MYLFLSLRTTHGSTFSCVRSRVRLPTERSSPKKKLFQVSNFIHSQKVGREKKREEKASYCSCSYH